MGKRSEAKKLEDLSWKEVSGVDHAANGAQMDGAEGWLVMKSDQLEERIDKALELLGDGPEETDLSKAFTKAESDGDHSASDYAYVPDPEKPSTWKLRIDDAQHVGGAAAALSGGGFRGQKADVPAGDLAGIKARVRAAWSKFNPDKDASEMPESIRKADGEGDLKCPKCGAMNEADAKTCDQCGASLEDVSKGRDNEGKEVHMPDAQGSDAFDKSSLSEEVRTYLEGIEKERDDAAKERDEAVAKADELKQAAGVAEPAAAESDEAVLAKALEALPEPVRKELENLRKDAEESRQRVTDAEGIAKAERDMRLDNQAIEDAREFVKGLTVKAEDIGPSLRKFASGEMTTEESAAFAEEIKRVLRSASELVQQGRAFTVVGKDGGLPGDGEEQIEALAKARVEAGTATDIVQARSQVLDTPEGKRLYEEYRLAKDTKGVR